MAAFRAARLADAAQPRRRSMLKVMLAKLLTVKIAAAAVAAVAVGGVAVAAVTGSVPAQPGNGGSTAPPMVTVPSTVNHVSANPVSRLGHNTGGA
ncbi:hypothetical protein [Kibdelosporangium aridum]|nr:hypothetical protein [Kibdelosporangium aridum]